MREKNVSKKMYFIDIYFLLQARNEQNYFSLSNHSI